MLLLRWGVYTRFTQHKTSNMIIDNIGGYIIMIGKSGKCDIQLL